MKYFEKLAKDQATTLKEMKVKELEVALAKSPWVTIPGGAAAGLGYAFLKGKKTYLPSMTGGVLAGQAAQNISKYYMKKELDLRKK